MRRLFAFALLSFLFLSGCRETLLYRGIGGSRKPAGGDCQKYGASSIISNNTGHVLNVPDVDVLISKAKTYDITGTAGHSHTVTISVNDFNLLSLGDPVTKTSSVGGGHTHSVFIECN